MATLPDLDEDEDDDAILEADPEDDKSPDFDEDSLLAAVQADELLEVDAMAREPSGDT